MLRNVGRVGELAPLPRSLKFSAKLYLPQSEGGLLPVELPSLAEITGNILIPRRGNYATAIIDSNCEQELTEFLFSLYLSTVAQRSRDFLKLFENQNRIRQFFRSCFQGISLPLDDINKAGLLKSDQDPQNSDGARPKIDRVATFLQHDDVLAALGDKLSTAGLIVQFETEMVGK